MSRPPRRFRRPDCSFPALALAAAALMGGTLVALPPAASCAGVAAAGVAQSGGIPQSIRTSDDPASHRPQIESFINTQAQRLMEEDPQVVAQARDLLGNQIADPQATPAFREYYTDLLSQKLASLVGTARPFNRLNLAIVTEKVARLSRSPRLLPLATQLVSDETASVAIWGARAGYGGLPEAFVAPGQAAQNARQFVEALVAAIKRFPHNGPLAQNAYETLSLRIRDRSAVPSREALAAGVPVVVPAIREIIAFRVGQLTGQNMELEPLAEEAALVFLVHPAVWPASADEQAETVTVLRDLMLQASRAAAVLDGQDRRDVIMLLKRIGSALAAPGLNDPADPVGRAAQAMDRMQPSVPQPDVERITQSVTQALANKYPNLPEPKLAAVSPPAEAQPAGGAEGEAGGGDATTQGEAGSGGGSPDQ